MDQNLATLETALRVLSAISERQAPNRADVEELRRCVPELKNSPPDELACEVVQRVSRTLPYVREITRRKSLTARVAG